MGLTVTVSELVTRVRQRADMETSLTDGVGSFITDSEIVHYLDRAYRALYDLLVTTYENYYIDSESISLVAGTDTYALPSDFYKVKGVDLRLPDGAATLKPFSFQERNRLSGASVPRYIVQGSNIKFLPEPTSAASVTLWYVPTPKSLTTSTSPTVTQQNSIDAINGYDDFIIIDAAIACLSKEDSDTRTLQAAKAEARARIIAAAPNKDESPQAVVDVDDLYEGSMLPWLRNGF